MCRPLGLKNQRVVRSHLIASRYRTTTTTTSRTSQLRAQENPQRQTTSQRIRVTPTHLEERKEMTGQEIEQHLFLI